MTVAKTFTGEVNITITDEENTIDDIPHVHTDTRIIKLIKSYSDTMEVVNRYEGSYVTDDSAGDVLIASWLAADSPDVLIIATNNPMLFDVQNNTNKSEIDYITVDGLFFVELATPLEAGAYYSSITRSTRDINTVVDFIDGVVVDWIIIAMKKTT
jgi:hypothetical protein